MIRIRIGKRRLHIPAPSPKTLSRWMLGLSIVVTFTAAGAYLNSRETDQVQRDINVTNDIIARVDSSCARSADESLSSMVRAIAAKECADTRRDADLKRSLSDTCIGFRKAMTPAALERFTRCDRPGVINQLEEAEPGQRPVVRADGTEDPNPSATKPDRRGPTVPPGDRPGGRPNPDPDPDPDPERPDTAPPPSAVPPSESPPPAGPESPPEDGINLPDVNVDVEVGDGGACADVGVGSIKVPVGRC